MPFRELAGVPDEVMEVLKRHDWPGNIRELQNVIERAVVMTTGPDLNLQPTEHMTRDARSAPIRTLADAERAHITAMLRETNGVVGGRRGAAAQLELPRTSLLARMQRLGIFSDTLGQRARQGNRLSVAVATGHPQVSRFA
jgi:transcriptional regulator of acetoin/glycerol metabolism